MGFDCEAITIIGLRLLEDDLKIPVTKTYTNCKCINNINNYKYCPDCGKKNQYGTYVEYQFIDQFSEKLCTGPESSDDDLYFPLYGHLNINDRTYPVYQPVEREKWLYVSIYFGIKHGPRNYRPENICKVSPTVILNNHLKEDLTSIGLWNEEDYNIYTLIEYSY